MCTANPSANPTPQVTLLDSLLVDEREKVHAKNLHGADADALKATRDRHFPRGELDDGGGAIPPIAAGLLPSDGRDGSPGATPEDFTLVDVVVDAMPLETIEYPEGVLGFADWLEARFKVRAGELVWKRTTLGVSLSAALSSSHASPTKPAPGAQTQIELARGVYRFVVRRACFPDDGSWGGCVKALLFAGGEGAAKLEATLLQGPAGTWSERVATLFTLLAKACHLEAVRGLTASAAPAAQRTDPLWLCAGDCSGLLAPRGPVAGADSDSAQPLLERGQDRGPLAAAGLRCRGAGAWPRRVLSPPRAPAADVCAAERALVALTAVRDCAAVLGAAVVLCALLRCRLSPTHARPERGHGSAVRRRVPAGRSARRRRASGLQVRLM